MREERQTEREGGGGGGGKSEIDKERSMKMHSCNVLKLNMCIAIEVHSAREQVPLVADGGTWQGESVDNFGPLGTESGNRVNRMDSLASHKMNTHVTKWTISSQCACEKRNTMMSGRRILQP